MRGQHGDYEQQVKDKWWAVKQHQGGQGLAKRLVLKKGSSGQGNKVYSSF